MKALWSHVFEPGFFGNGPVHLALVLGAVIAVTSSVVGVFAVLREQSFGGHALTDVSTAGGAGALLLGLSPLTGFVVGGILGAGAMDTIGARERRGRDLATGIVLGAATGLAALFLYLDSTTGAATGAPQQILFGSIFLLSSSTLPYVAAFSGLALVVVAALYRPLLLSSLNEEIARAKAVPLHLVSMSYLAALAVAVALSSLVVGTILSTALLIGPPATALRLTRRLSSAIPLAAVLGIATTWGGVLLAYDSYDWGASHDAWPVSFFIVVLVFLSYVGAGGLAALRGDGRRRRRGHVEVGVPETVTG